jgi:hypothetical protein
MKNVFIKTSLKNKKTIGDKYALTFSNGWEVIKKGE